MVNTALPLTLASLKPPLPVKTTLVTQTPGALGLRLQLPTNSLALLPLTSVGTQLISDSFGKPWRVALTVAVHLGVSPR